MGHWGGTFKGSVTVENDSKYKFSGDLSLHLKDAFIDPFNILNVVKDDIDLPGTNPFKIIGSWKELFFGVGQLTFQA